MGYELAEQYNWKLPDVIIYPTGGGTGIIGMWKAFQEMEKLGWIDEKRPRMISVQAKGCAPIVEAYEKGWSESKFWKNAETIAAGLRVPHAIGDFLILKAVRESKGKAIQVSDESLLVSTKKMAASEGIYPCPEGAATLSACIKMVEQGDIDKDEKVVLFNTGTGLKYTELRKTKFRTLDIKKKINYQDLA